MDELPGIYKLGILISVGSSVSFIVGSVFVILKYMVTKFYRPMTYHQWFVLGFISTYAAGIPDQGWWGVAWSFRYLDRIEQWAWTADNGLWINIVFRQAMKLFGLYCHLRAAVEYGLSTRENLSSICRNLAIIGLGTALTLFLIGELQQLGKAMSRPLREGFTEIVRRSSD